MKIIGLAVCSVLFFLACPVSVQADTRTASNAESVYESEMLESDENETGGDLGDVPEDAGERMNVRTIHAGGINEDDLELLSEDDSSDIESLISVSCDHTDIFPYLDSIQNLIAAINILLGIQVGCICAMIFSIFWRY